MWKFFLTFLLTYGTMHALFFHRIRVLLPDQRWVHSFVIALLVIMIITPLSSFPLERSGHEALARILAWLGFSWMGFVFLASVLVIGLDIIDIILWAGRGFTSWSLPSFNGRVPAVIVLASALILCLYGFFEARHLRVGRLTITTNKLPKEVDRLRIAQISDAHVGLISGEHLLSQIIAVLEGERPDIVVSTGDLLDSSASHIDGISETLYRIKSRHGKYAVTGNHEYYPGLQQSLAFLKRAGFTVLRNEVETINPLINIAGVDDPAVGIRTDEAALLASAHNGLFTLFLKHRPHVPPETIGLFDLQLSGHTHNGQIFPFNFVVSVPYPYIGGFYLLKNGISLYTSPGAGTWGSPMRVFSPPEITVIDIISAHGKDDPDRHW